MQGILTVTYLHSAMAASGGSKVTFSAMKYAWGKARGVLFHFSFELKSQSVNSNSIFEAVEQIDVSSQLTVTNRKVTLGGLLTRSGGFSCGEEGKLLE